MTAQWGEELIATQYNSKTLPPTSISTKSLYLSSDVTFLYQGTKLLMPAPSILEGLNFCSPACWLCALESSVILGMFV